MNKLVDKEWGQENWVVNTNLYCGKILILKKGYHSSMHHHKEKDEAFYILSGLVKLEILDDKVHMMKPSDSIRIKPGTYHRFTGVMDSQIIEFSTHHKDSDTVRLSKSGKVRIIFVDIDGFLCTEEMGHYTKVKPLKNHIKKVNDLYFEGNQIIIWTARGTTDGKDYRQLTEKQLEEWDVKYHELRFGKPYYDEWWDDKACLP